MEFLPPTLPTMFIFLLKCFLTCIYGGLTHTHFLSFNPRGQRDRLRRVYVPLNPGVELEVMRLKRGQPTVG